MNQKKCKYYLGSPKLKTKLLSMKSVRKNIQCPFLLRFELHTPTQYALSCKIPKFKFYVNQKKSKKYLGSPKLKTKLL